MSRFVSRDIDPESTLADLIANARKRKGVSIEDAARALAIQPHYLRAFEEGHLDELPGPVYARKYLEHYCRYLGLPLTLLRERFDQSLGAGFWMRLPREIKVTRRHFTVWPRRVRGMIVAGGLAILAGYFAYQLVIRMQPPLLIVDFPPDGFNTHRSLLTFSGRTEPETRLTINGAPAPVDALGQFAVSLSLNDGINYIRLSASRRMGKERVMEVKVILE